MKNFFQFIRRFFNLILFLVLEVICCVMISKTNTLQGNDLVNSSNAVSGYFYKQQDALTYYFRLREMNDSLLNENKQLRTLMSEKYYSVDRVGDSLTTIKINPLDSLHKVKYAQYVYRTAKVINNSIAKDNNYITIDRGSSDGIREGMGVISGTGVVGKVVHTSAHFATVLSVLSEIQTVSAKFKDGTTGFAKWTFEKRAPKSDVYYMPEVPRDITLHIGDSVFTTSFSFFPPDVLVGTIVKSEFVTKTGKRLLTLKPGTNFRNVQYVYVTDNIMMEERNELEKITEAPKKKEGRK